MYNFHHLFLLKQHSAVPSLGWSPTVLSTQKNVCVLMQLCAHEQTFTAVNELFADSSSAPGQ